MPSLPEPPEPAVPRDASVSARDAGVPPDAGALGDADVPRDALVMLVGAAGSGKSTWARRAFPPHAVVSSDDIRAMVSDDATDQGASADAFRVLHAVAEARLRRGLLTVVDATNLSAAARRPLRAMAARWSRPSVAVVFDLPLETCLARNAERAIGRVPDDVVRRQHAGLGAALADLEGEGFAAVRVLRGGHPAP